MKTILFIAHSPDFYGADRVLHQVIDAVRCDFRVHVALPGEGEMARRLREFPEVGLSVLPLPRFSLAAGDMAATAGTFLPFLLQFKRLLSRLKPSLVYGNTVRSLIPVAAARRLGYRTLVHFHERNVPGAAGPWIAKLAGRAGRRNIFVCRSALESYAAFSPELRHNSTVIYNGTGMTPPEGVQHPDPREFRGGAPKLLSVAQLASHKRIGDLLEAMPVILAAYPRAVLVVLGEGDLRGDLERRIRELDLEDRVLLPGYVKDPTLLLAAADIFLAPFKNEACNMAVIEAMANGRPVVAASGGGMPELVAEGETGYLHPAGDVPQMTDRVLRLAGSAELRRLFGEAALRRVRESFSLEVQMDRIRQEIEAVVRGNEGNKS